MTRAWNHRQRCAGHVAVTGAGRVCILPGQAEGEVVAFAEAMVRMAAAAGRRILPAGPARTAPSAERLRHAGCVGHVDARELGFGRLCYGRRSSAAEVLQFAVVVAGERRALERLIAGRRELALELASAGWGSGAPVELAAPLESWAAA